MGLARLLVHFAGLIRAATRRTDLLVLASINSSSPDGSVTCNQPGPWSDV
jgi:hypothetical protein